MVTAADLAASGFVRCRCGGVNIPSSDAFREQVRASGHDPAEFDRCLTCEQYAAIDAAREAGIVFGLNDFDTILGRARRGSGPRLLVHARHCRVISDATITAVTAAVWSRAEYPQDSLRQVDWIDLFTAAGFTIDGQPAERPKKPVTLWRGCVPRLRRRMSWTSDRVKAEEFASGLQYRPEGKLYQTTAPPEAVLCINDASRRESEYVINTRGLAIREASD